MGIELDFVLYAVSLLLLAVYSGASVALEILSLSTSDRSVEDDDEESSHTDAAGEDPVRIGIALGVARGCAIALTVIMSIRVGYLHLFGPGDGALLSIAVFVFLSLL